MAKLKDKTVESKISIRITPRASRNEVCEVFDDETIKIKIKAPPVDGKANQEVVKFLSDILEINTSMIEIYSGLTSRNKSISIMGIEHQEVMKRIVQKIKQ